MTAVRVIHGDCVEQLRHLAREGVLADGCVSDPPYHLASIVARLGSPEAAEIQSGETGVYARSSRGFMGQQWDGGDVAFRPDTWRRVYDVLKPGAYLVAFASTKGYHRLACAIEDAGFEIRDMVAWLYGSGFPKSHNLDGDHQGWGTAIKPAIEPIVLAQKPISETSIAANVARWGVGALNIDAARVGINPNERFDGGGQSLNGVNVDTHAPGWRRPWMENPDAIVAHRDRLRAGVEKARQLGRWPANVCHDGSDEVLAAFAAFGDRGAAAPVTTRNAPMFGSVYQPYEAPIVNPGATFHADSGSAARFFYSSKATQGERIFECQECGAHTKGKPSCGHDAFRTHPTVKPPSLMGWLIDLICPPGGLILDPFAGTGTTAEAARDRGMQTLLIEASADHIRDIGVRLSLPVDDIITAEVAAIAAAGPRNGQGLLL